ncbi:Bifunctional dethiobiotin synthetase/7,8-diamino-pelargonic acid aminotransferase, mitochondrial [Turnera subulata]|uniref:Bifunctional dethiobiotin synthetase/7,8-diamino-pelargonic acid aminotransferase, mitochondrial n=1 Tax=Turnera subulata TaxID=218843 RepID=A0A9Q0FBQ0_9ROSI|nr:Bifunctional dethiobiotin synthetase/7,8-diamino-pelargonic acid aminotransferase, mitochondrial [Turnera subulata]
MLFLRRRQHHLHHHSLRLLHRKLLSTTSQALHLPLCHPTYMIWASNTSLGKTLVSTGLASSFLLSSPSSTTPRKFLYLKPLQTGFPSDSDSRFVFSKLHSLSSLRSSSLVASNSVLRSSLPAAADLTSRPDLSRRFGFCDPNFREEATVSRRDGAAVSELVCETLYAWKDAVSPHLSAERESGAVEDSQVEETLEKRLRIGLEGAGMDVFCVVETAGGVASPGPSGTLQCDLYRPFRLPGVLVGDGRLGGISGTISAYETLKLRGYDIVAVVFGDHGLANEGPLLSYLRNRVPVFVLPHVPEDMSDDLLEWFSASGEVFNSLKEIMLSAYSKRMQRLNDMPKKAGDVLWWPFTQHTLVPEEKVTVIDSRCGENFAVYKGENDEFMTQQFDACASWWTQGPDATLQIVYSLSFKKSPKHSSTDTSTRWFQTELARDIGYAAARFGHVMFPENVYEPALECAELLLSGVGRGWASRVYFSDNGSTAIEVALKMAFRKFTCANANILQLLNNNKSEGCIELKVLALKGCYHGDTLGAMEAQAPSPYTGFLQQPWYTGRGLFLDPPTVSMHNSYWNISLPEGMHSNYVIKELAFDSRDEIFDKSRDKSDLAVTYSSYISQKLVQYDSLEGTVHIGALIIEPGKEAIRISLILDARYVFHSLWLFSPVIQGAGGMLMIDPLFQRVLVNECRSRNIPVIFDEVFTGFWRLGTESAAELLGCVPDIACFAKLLTGGVIPLAVTLATDAVFDSFIGESKLKALLHGHSYTAHAMGCSAAVKAIQWFSDPQTNFNVIPDKSLLSELWNVDLIQQISSHPSVQRVVALGTLFALELRVEGPNAGYASLYASSLLQKLREDGVYMRPLGNVVYLMCGPCTPPQVCTQLLLKLLTRLDEFTQDQVRQASC